jgi:hypothetical protein
MHAFAGMTLGWAAYGCVESGKLERPLTPDPLPGGEGGVVAGKAN